MSFPQEGQVASGGNEFGFQNLEQSSHQGMVDQSRLRTRSLIGVEPNPHSSRSERSR
jgi:hypothetical protein